MSPRPNPSTAPTVETPRTFPALLALLGMIAPLSINMYLPVLPAMSGGPTETGGFTNRPDAILGVPAV